MTLRFEAIHTDGIAQISYLIGDDSTGVAAVIDPRCDCEIYLQLARKYRLAITHAFETHIHADFMSGSRELRERLGKLEICVSGMDDPDYGYDCHRISAGDTFQFGAATLTARHTPGHTPEHLAFEIAETNRPAHPWGILTGDSLFVGSAGRPDLLGKEKSEELTKQLFSTLREYYLNLDDEIMIFPGHGAGSACGASIGERPSSTIGHERRHNPFLQIDTLDEFSKFVASGAPPVPAHYPRLKKVNQKPKVVGHTPTCPPLSADEFRSLVSQADSFTTLDTRDILAFGGGHVPGAINIADRPELSVWVGDMLSPEKSLLLILENDSALERIIRSMWRVGVTDFRGYLTGGMQSWNAKGFPLDQIPQMSVHELHQQQDSIQILDVRRDSEWDAGHIPGAVHHYVATMRDGTSGMDAIDSSQPVAVYCGSGYRASIAASIMQKDGFKDVRNVPGSWQAWKAQSFPTS